MRSPLTVPAMQRFGSSGKSGMPCAMSLIGAREEGDAVVGALAAVHRVIAGVAQLGEREVRVLGLGLLQAGDIGLALVEPGEESG